MGSTTLVSRMPSPSLWPQSSLLSVMAGFLWFAEHLFIRWPAFFLKSPASRTLVTGLYSSPRVPGCWWRGHSKYSWGLLPVKWTYVSAWILDSCFLSLSLKGGLQFCLQMLYFPASIHLRSPKTPRAVGWGEMPTHTMLEGLQIVRVFSGGSTAVGSKC